MRTECQDGNAHKPFAGHRDLAGAVMEGSNRQREKKSEGNTEITWSDSAWVWHRKRLYLFSCAYQLKPKCSQVLKIPGLAKVHSIPNAIHLKQLRLVVRLYGVALPWPHPSLSGVNASSSPSNLTIPPGIFSMLSSSIKYVDSPPLHSLTQLTGTFLKKIFSYSLHILLVVLFLAFWHQICPLLHHINSGPLPMISDPNL